MDTDTDRAQLIIIAALLIAVLFVGLAVVVNSAIYTENVATRGATTTGDIVADDTESIQRMEESLADANYYDDTADFDERESRVQADLEEWNTKMAGQSARAGQATGYESAGMTEGVRVSQDETGDFMPANPGLLESAVYEGTEYRLDPLGLADRTNWLVAPNVTTRAFVMEDIERESLKTIDESLLTDFLDLLNTILTGSDTFWIEFDDGDTIWRVYLVEIDTTGDNEVAAVITEDNGNDESVVGTCSVAGDSVDVRLSEGTLVGDGETVSCPELSFLDDLERYDIYYVGADEIEGTYQFIVDKNENEFRDELDDRYTTLIIVTIENLLEHILDVVTDIPIIGDIIAELIDGIIDILGEIDNIIAALIDLGEDDMADLVELWGDFTTDDVYTTGPADGHPYTTSAVYDVSVTTTYTDDRIRHERTVQVAPEAA